MKQVPLSGIRKNPLLYLVVHDIALSMKNLNPSGMTRDKFKKTRADEFLSQTL